MNSRFILDISEIVRNLSDNDFDEFAASENYFFQKFEHLKEPYQEHKLQRQENPRLSGESWRAFLREIRLWKDLDLPHMYARIMQLAQDYKGNFEYFEISTDNGVYVVPDRITLLNRLLQMSHLLLHEIYPKIEQSLNYESDSDVIDSPIIKGKIDWNKTILNTVNKSQKYPTSFVSLIPTQEFETPENMLSLVSLFWLRNDSLKLMRNYQPTELSKREISILNQIFTNSNIAIERSILKRIEDQANQISISGQKNKRVSELISQTKERIHQGLVRQITYTQLIEWVEKYLNLNTERFAKDLTNFRLDKVEDVDKMYELWILFELVRYLDEKYIIKFKPIIESKNQFHGFEITINNKTFQLKYQESYPGQVHESHEPDYTFEKGPNNIPIVLDAKNWRGNKRDAKNTMIVYVMELAKKKASKGVLFFSNNKELAENQESSYNEKKYGPNEEYSLITCVLTPSRTQETQKQNNIVFEGISKIIESM